MDGGALIGRERDISGNIAGPPSARLGPSNKRTGCSATPFIPIHQPTTPWCCIFIIIDMLAVDDAIPPASRVVGMHFAILTTRLAPS